jgi:hypothetical protein
VGLTVSARPRLFWYQSAATNLPIVFSLARADAVEPMLEFTLKGSTLAGEVRVDLADFGVSLEQDSEYRWVVAIVPDPDRRSRDLLTEGRIMRVAPSSELARDLAGADAQGRAAAYARHSIWYDALTEVNEGARTAPQDAQWQLWRASLLKEVGLDEATAQAAPAPPAGRTPAYTPARVGAPSRLISTATRTGTGEGPAGQGAPSPAGAVRLQRTAAAPGMGMIGVLAAAPESLTARTEPVLLWYASGPSAAPIVLRVVSTEAETPACEVTVRGSDLSGVRRLKLADFGICLPTDQSYSWTVALVPDPLDRSRDLTAGTTLRRVDLPPEARAEADRAASADLPGVLARQGAWCDALAVLYDQLASQPQDPELRTRWQQALQQIGLQELAASALPPAQ